MNFLQCPQDSAIRTLFLQKQMTESPWWVGRCTGVFSRDMLTEVTVVVVEFCVLHGHARNLLDFHTAQEAPANH